MRSRTLVIITLLALCHLSSRGQTLTTGLPESESRAESDVQSSSQVELPDAPSQEILPEAVPEAVPPTGVPVEFEAERQTRQGDTITLSGNVVVRYRDYLLQADQLVYHQATSEIEADGHVQISGGPYDVTIEASRGQLRLDMHTARFYNVKGSMGLRQMGRKSIYSTTNPMLFSGRVVLQNGEGNYKVVDGSITNCRLPKPDWILISRAINVADGKASMANTFFKFLGVPLFYLPYLSHPVDELGRQSGFMIPVFSTSTTRGLVLSEQFYWAISRSMDMTIGAEYYSKRGFAPNGDFRYRGPGRDYLNVHWNALFDRGTQSTSTSSSVFSSFGGADIRAMGHMDLSPQTRLAGNIEYLSSYAYRLIFSDNYTQATSSEVQSTLSLTHNHEGLVSSAALARYQTFASAAKGDELRILHLPGLRFDAIERPLGQTPLNWSLGSSLNYLGRSENNFHVRNLGRFDLWPRLSLPMQMGGWTLTPEAALRYTFYSVSQQDNGSTLPTISHDPLSRMSYEAAVNLRAPVVLRDFTLNRWNRVLRHTIEPEFGYRFVNGIAEQARKVILIDTTDIATNTNEAGYSLTQRFYWRPIHAPVCTAEQAASEKGCPAPMRQWASWQIAQKLYFDPRFGNALSQIPYRRNVFDTTLDLTGVTFLTSERDVSPIISRLRFEGSENLRLEWDLDYDPVGGRLSSNNIYAGYTHGRATVGLGHALLKAIDATQSKTILKSHQVQPFLYIGNQASSGFNLAVNSGYDIANGALQYAGIQSIYNWNCCGLSLGYRRYALGTTGTVSRNETQWLYSFTLANFGSFGDIRRSNQVFRDPALPPAF